MTLGLKITGKTYSEIGQELFLSLIQQRSQEEIEKIIADNYPQIEKAEFKFWPFWVQKAPGNVERITIHIELGD